ncbi:glyoxylase-like metal-dependent hydrolase (beta-lactamase superfamily II) [Metabacillus crassostreae]|uniref:MBL fold metallo-hydrolase n=1 Tax=Metabacillus crassostreae TaxID=929098 RepID=UPI0019578BE0|nr:MBL fold metallo-hydrolase [Metabacillus crassostreae]MBM7604528.1 glyoxylase-like metal-dependent hydrolase (beta-lactamase superfamily II) [Metabacillus crassostreae]
MMPITDSEQVYKFELPTPFPVGDVNVYLIKGERLTLVDAGPKTEEAWHSFLQQLNEVGYKPEDIEQIIITHHHPDHVGMLDFFSKDIPVYGHVFNSPWLVQDQQFMSKQAQFFERILVEFGVDQRFMPYVKRLNDMLVYSCHRELTGVLKEGDKIDGLDNWRVLETPGHAQSHIVLYDEKSRVLIGGDLLLKHISPNPLLEPSMIEGVNDRPKPQLQLNESLAKLLELPISLVYSGHGENIVEVNDLITYRLKKQAERAEQVRKFIAEKPLTAFEVSKVLFPTIYHKQLMLTMSETVGQLDYLQEIGQIRVDISKNQHMYFVT